MRADYVIQLHHDNDLSYSSLLTTSCHDESNVSMVILTTPIMIYLANKRHSGREHSRTKHYSTVAKDYQHDLHHYSADHEKQGHNR